MCGRFTLTKPDYGQMARTLGVEPREEYAAQYRPRWNIPPTDPHWMLRLDPETGKRTLDPARWGLVNHWAKDRARAAQQINARMESAAEKPAFRQAFAKRRCAVPADGWFEWFGPPKGKRAIWVHPPDDGIFLFAGLWETWKDPKSEELLRTFSILTQDARGRPARYHDRMPVILKPDAVDTWLSPASAIGAPEAFIRSVEETAMEAWEPLEVSTRVNSVKYDDPACLEPAVPPEPPTGQTGSLF